MSSSFDEHFAALPIIAILRGIRLHEVDDVARVLLDEGIRLIEIPLNSPQALAGIARLAAFVGKSATIGAGTVTRLSEVQSVIQAGGELIVSPHCAPDIIQASVQAGALPIPGVRTATEAFQAVHAGARILKFFPAAIQIASEIGALKAILPSGIRILAVGGVSAANAGVFRRQGADGLGVGSSIFKPGEKLGDLRNHVRGFVKNWQQV